MNDVFPNYIDELFPPSKNRFSNKRKGKMFSKNGKKYKNFNYKKIKSMIKYAQQWGVDIVWVKEGEEIEVLYDNGAYFGSGNGWSVERNYGKMEKEKIKEKMWDDGFCTGGKYRVVFYKQSAIYTSCGDSIGGKRVFGKILYICK